VRKIAVTKKKYNPIEKAIAWFLGKPSNKTDATWFSYGTKDLSRKGTARDRHYKPGYQRFANHFFCSIVAGAFFYGLGADPVLTLGSTMSLGAIFASWYVIAFVQNKMYEEHDIKSDALFDKLSEVIPKLSRGYYEYDVSGEFMHLRLPDKFDAAPTKQENITSILERHYKWDFEATWHFSDHPPTVTWRRLPEPPEVFPWAQAKPIAAKLSDSQLLLGINGKGESVINDLDTDAPHILMSVGTGGTKSTMLAGFIAQGLYKNVEHIYVLDPKRQSLNCFNGISRVTISRSAAAMTQTIAHVAGIAEERKKHDDNSFGEPTRFPRIWLVIEEGNSFNVMIDEYWESIKSNKDKGKAPAQQQLESMLMQGRSLGINIIRVSQHASVAGVSSGRGSTGGAAARGQYGAVIFSRFTHEAWESITGFSENDIPKMKDILGRCVLYTMRDRSTDVFQNIYIKMDEAHEEALAAPEATTERPSFTPVEPVQQEQLYELKQCSSDGGIGIVDVKYQTLRRWRDAANGTWQGTPRGSKIWYTVDQIKHNVSARC
jgi:hypothetical protein